ncbi:MAG: hypothetical protein KGR26_08050, partial [Cyanobacteria bacterium REEB65]|nr:hypothetical protein [Cyanobacteria bacterium REEB65]
MNLFAALRDAVLGTFNRRDSQAELPGSDPRGGTGAGMAILDGEAQVAPARRSTGYLPSLDAEHRARDFAAAAKPLPHIDAPKAARMVGDEGLENILGVIDRLEREALPFKTLIVERLAA